MILTVTLNAALDVTYTVDALVPYATHRIGSVTARAGGKGVNVARVAAALGHETAVTGFAGGATGTAIRAELAAAGLRDELVAVAAESRRTATVVDGVDATGFHEPGPEVRTTEWSAFCASFAGLARAAHVVVCSGSLPPGVPLDAYAVLVDIARRHGARTVVDAEGSSLRAALAARPDIVKPNLAELTATVGITEPLAGGRALCAAGARSVVVSSGPDGLLAVTGEGTWRARPPRRIRGNPTGAGDAAVAALAAGLVHDAPWPRRLRDATALSAAAVAAPLAGEFDAPAYHRMRVEISLEELDATHLDR
ncbi:1-phosphofructokinase family hexose kinase [Pseudonocardia nigra]|uniref:1-phosphofructokinase family hexose kinase n=1 Tax=Pseudonocardia nigra TaxID=1921578 RepID=UPI001C602466|nr:1-phosphofructokinase family hexose kinase [Pseudonocardia nigra]